MLRLAMAGVDAVRPGALLPPLLEGLFDGRPCHLLALGKAAGDMAAAAATSLDSGLLDGLVIGPAGAAEAPPGLRGLEAEHPLPGPGSFAAGKALLDWLAALDDDAPLLLLLSGGGSAMLEQPVAGISMADCIDIHRWCLGSGLPINSINAIRSRFSQLKSGGLAARAGNRDMLGLVLSDIPGGDLASVASGPFSAQLVQRFDGLRAVLPPWLVELADRARPVPRSWAPLWRIADNSDAVAAVIAAAHDEGLAVADQGELDGDLPALAARLAASLREGPAGLYVYGGEPTLQLPPGPGLGGRCQHLALELAQQLDGLDDWCALALATDGIDGNSSAAGAFADPGSLQRGRDAGLDAAQSLAAADSGRFLEAAGDLVDTGPTGTNVTDLLLLHKS